MDPVATLLSRLENVKRLGAGHTARCPAHEDNTNSLKVDVGDDGQALIHCHAGCSPDKVLRALDMELKDLFPPSGASVMQNGQGKRVVSTKRYELPGLAVHVRRDYSDGTKSVHWEQPNGLKGLGVHKLVDLPLWGADAIGGHDDVVVVEGEKACDALTSIGIFAVGTVTGAASIPGDASLRPLLGRRLFLWADNDGPGRTHMDRIAERLLALGQPPEKIRVIVWKNAPEKGDAADWIATGGKPETLRKRFETAPQWNKSDDLLDDAETTEEEPRSRSYAEILALDLPPARPLVEGLIDEGSGCILAGPGGTGKTWLSLDLARAIASGTPWLGHFPTGQAPVLVIDEEGNERGLQGRLRLLDAAQPLEDPPIWFTIGFGLKIDADATEQIIAQEIERYAPGIVIFDSLTRMHSANENDASEMSRVFARFSTLRRLYGCTVVLIDHLRKKGLINDEAEMLRGSTDKRNWPDTILFVSPAESGTMTVSHIKSRYGQAVPDFTVAMEIDNDAGTGRIRYQGQAPSQSIAKGNEIVAAIHALKAQLGEDGADILKIAAWLDVSDETVRKHIKRLVEQSILGVRQIRTDGRSRNVYDAIGGVS